MRLAFLTIPLACMGLAGCMETGPGPINAPPPHQAATRVERGTIVGLRQVAVEGSNANSQATGTLIGAAAGALIGNQFGEGSGKTAMTVVGAGAGALAGNEIAKQNSRGVTYHHVWTVRMRDGRTMRIVQDGGGLRVGDHVRVLFLANGSARIERI